MEVVKGTFGPEDCLNDITEIKFDRPLPIKVCVILVHGVLQLYNHYGCQTLSGKLILTLKADFDLDS